VDVLVIKFSCINQRLRRITSGIIPSNAYGKLKFEFDFRTEDWNAAEIKTANFYYKGENYPIELDENNQCLVPEEVIYTPSFNVAVHGGDIITNYVRNYVDNMSSNTGGITPPSGGGDSSGVVFVPSISENKILSWTIVDNNDEVKVPDPVDLNPFDEWVDDENISEYIWEEE
jgi:hypothetical protein